MFKITNKPINNNVVLIPKSLYYTIHKIYEHYFPFPTKSPPEFSFNYLFRIYLDLLFRPSRKRIYFKYKMYILNV